MGRLGGLLAVRVFIALDFVFCCCRSLILWRDLSVCGIGLFSELSFLKCRRRIWSFWLLLLLLSSFFVLILVLGVLMLCELLRGGFQLGRNSFVQQAPRSFKHVPSLTQVAGKHEHQQQHFAPFCKNRGCRSLDCPVFFFLPLKKAAACFPAVRSETAFRMAWACPSWTSLEFLFVRFALRSLLLLRLLLRLPRCLLDGLAWPALSWTLLGILYVRCVGLTCRECKNEDECVVACGWVSYFTCWGLGRSGRVVLHFSFRIMKV